MEITREFLEQHKTELGRRMAQLRQQRAQLDADLCGTEGAIRNCDFFLQELAKAPPPPSPTTEPAPMPPPSKKKPAPKH